MPVCKTGQAGSSPARKSSVRMFGFLIWFTVRRVIIWISRLFRKKSSVSSVTVEDIYITFNKYRKAVYEEKKAKNVQ